MNAALQCFLSGRLRLPIMFRKTAVLADVRAFPQSGQPTAIFFHANIPYAVERAELNSLLQVKS